MSDAERGDLAVAKHEELVELLRHLTKTNLAIGEALYEIQKHRLWENHAQSPTEYFYLAGTEVGYGQAMKLMAVYEHYVLNFGVDEDLLSRVGIEKAHMLIPKIKTVDDAKRYLSDAVGMTIKEIEQILTEDERPSTGVLASIEDATVRRAVEAYLKQTPDQRQDFHYEINRIAGERHIEE